MSNKLPIGCREIELEVLGDERGSLISLEAGTGVPFTIERTYYIFGTRAGVVRGLHAHRRLTQWAVCVAGACTILLEDGQQTADVRLDRPDLALEVGPMIWHEMRDFAPSTVLMVLADGPYDEADYIRDHAEFERLAAERP